MVPRSHVRQLPLRPSRTPPKDRRTRPAAFRDGSRYRERACATAPWTTCTCAGDTGMLHFRRRLSQPRRVRRAMLCGREPTVQSLLMLPWAFHRTRECRECGLACTLRHVLRQGDVLATQSRCNITSVLLEWKRREAEGEAWLKHGVRRWGAPVGASSGRAQPDEPGRWDINRSREESRRRNGIDSLERGPERVRPRVTGARETPFFSSSSSSSSSSGDRRTSGGDGAGRSRP